MTVEHLEMHVTHIFFLPNAYPHADSWHDIAWRWHAEPESLSDLWIDIFSEGRYERICWISGFLVLVAA